MKNQDKNFLIDENQPYAELWMGSHHLGECLVNDVGESYENVKLSKFLQDYPEFIGTIPIINKYGYNIPFLFKVLSIEKPLSIQVHPDKELAKILNEKDPKNYPDTNYKPEIAIALTDFEAIISFRTHDEIEYNLIHISSFKKLIGEDLIDKYIKSTDCFDKKIALKNLFIKLMNSNENLVVQEINYLKNLFKNDSVNLDDTKKLFLKINSYYPKDIGCFSVFLLNYVKLSPGQSIFIDAGEPHCYIYGDCIECMACSDNTIRAGLTNKYKDLNTLCKCLTYNTFSPKNLILNPTFIDQNIKSYETKIKEFCIDLIQLKNKTNYFLNKKESGSILIVIKGETVINNFKIKPGFIFYLPAMVSLNLTSINSDFIMYRAYCTH